MYVACIPIFRLITPGKQVLLAWQHALLSCADIEVVHQVLVPPYIARTSHKHIHAPYLRHDGQGVGGVNVQVVKQCVHVLAPLRHLAPGGVQ